MIWLQVNINKPAKTEFTLFTYIEELPFLLVDQQILKMAILGKENQLTEEIYNFLNKINIRKSLKSLSNEKSSFFGVFNVYLWHFSSEREQLY